MKSTEPARVSLALFALALALTVAVHVWNATAPYTYARGFISSVFATSARTFARVGIFQLRGVPVDNNPPIGRADAYPHWPPLFPGVLSIWFRFFGVSEMAGHLWMLIVEIVTALLVVTIARNWLGPVGGRLAGFFWLTLPVVVHYGHVLLAESPAIMLMLFSVLAFQRSWRWAGALAAFLAVCTSWEAVLLAPGLWAAAAANKNPGERRMAAWSTVAIGAAVTFIVACYAFYNPAVFKDTIHTAQFRMGLSRVYSEQVIVSSTERYVGLEESISRILWNFPRMLGFFGAAALVQMAISRPKGSAVILFGLGSPWLLWCILMRNHMAVHDIEMLLAAPLAAIALASMALGVSRDRLRAGKGWAVAGLVALVISVQPWVLGIAPSPENPEQMLGFAAGIRRATGPDAVVLSPLVSAIPLYYSERHLVRCISDEAMMRRVLPQVRDQYPGARFYWATPLDSPPWVTVTEVR